MKNKVKSLLLALIIVSLLLSACSQPKPEDTVNNFFSSLKNGDTASASKLMIQNKDSEEPFKFDSKEQEEMIKLIFAKVSCQVNSTSIEGDKAIVKAKINSPDLVKIIGKMMTDMLSIAFASAFGGENDNSEELFNQYFTNSLADPNMPMTSSDIDIMLKKDNNAWYLVPDDNLINAMTGNFYKALESFEDNTALSKDPENDLELGEYECISENSIFYIVGTITNKSNNTYSYVQVNINLYDKDENLVGTTFDNINNLAPNKTWKFKATIMEDDVDTYEIANIDGY